MHTLFLENIENKSWVALFFLCYLLLSFSKNVMLNISEEVFSVFLASFSFIDHSFCDVQSEFGFKKLQKTSVLNICAEVRYTRTREKGKDIFPIQVTWIVISREEQQMIWTETSYQGNWPWKGQSENKGKKWAD